MKFFNVVFLFLVLNYFSTALNFLQTLNGLFCFSQTNSESNLIASNVVSISVPYGSSNIDLQSFCNGGRIKGYDDNEAIGYTTTCEVKNRSFSCSSHSLKSNPSKDVKYSCDCDAGSRSFDPINVIITRENVFQTFNGSLTEHNVMCSVNVSVGQCALDNGFYIRFAAISLSLLALLFILSCFTNSSVWLFEYFLLKLNFKTDSLIKYGFIGYCDWFVGGRSYCCEGDGYSFTEDGVPSDFIPSFSQNSNFFNITRRSNRHCLDLKIGTMERKMHLEIGIDELSVLSNCLKMIIIGKKIHKGDHFLSLDEIIAKCKEGKKIAQTGFSGFLFGYPTLLDKLISHSRCFFGCFRQDAIDQVLKHNIKNPCPEEIKSSEWKLYLSDVNFHIGFRRSSKLKQFGPSKGYLQYVEGMGCLKTNKGAFLSEKESEIIENKALLKPELNPERKRKFPVKFNKFPFPPENKEPQKVGDWVKNHDDLKPKVYSATCEEVLADKHSFLIDGDEAVRRKDGCFKFKKSFLEVLKEDYKNRKDHLRFIGEHVPYKHENLKHHRICSHGLATENFKWSKQISVINKISDINGFIKDTAPMIKRAVYGNHKMDDVNFLRSIKKRMNEVIEISPNPFELTENAIELNHLLLQYSLGRENQSLFFFPSKGKAIAQQVDLVKLKSNIEEVESAVCSGNEEFFKRKKRINFGGKKKKKKKNNNNNKKGGNRRGESKNSGFDPNPRFEDERSDRSKIKKVCIKMSGALTKLYTKSNSFCKKINRIIMGKAEEGEALLSANNMLHRGIKFKDWGVTNKLLSLIYRGCVEKEPCFKNGYCSNDSVVNQLSINLERYYNLNYTKGDTVMGARGILEEEFNKEFNGKISLDRFLATDI